MSNNTRAYHPNRQLGEMCKTQVHSGHCGIFSCSCTRMQNEAIVSKVYACLNTLECQSRSVRLFCDTPMTKVGSRNLSESCVKTPPDSRHLRTVLPLLLCSPFRVGSSVTFRQSRRREAFDGKRKKSVVVCLSDKKVDLKKKKKNAWRKSKLGGSVRGRSACTCS